MPDAWTRLAAEAERLKQCRLRDLFARDNRRFSRFSLSLDDLTIDFSKEKIDASVLDALFALAREAGLEQRRDALFAGKHVNETEDRPALHMALRGGAAPPPGDDVGATRERFLAFAEAVRKGDYAAAAGPFAAVVNIGIGGSDLGPVMAARALAPDRDGPELHFVSNVDGAHLADVTRNLDPARTLVIVASKTFTTLETMTNARSARDWLAGAVDKPGRHMAAVSSNVSAAAEFGIEESRVFGFWDWVGGRYSLWSSIGLPVAIGIGAERFRRFLDGAAAMDGHFRQAPLDRNLPVLMGLISVWRRNAMGWPTVALIPYDQRLERFPAYVQQLAMESNGKRVTRDGRPVSRATAPVVWGEPGTNAQHSFFQLIHQGTDVVPVDFVLAAGPRSADRHHHDILVANCLAQSQALAFGMTEDEVRSQMAEAGVDETEIDRLAPHRTFPGDRPSTTIVHRRLDPYALGRLVALYEHKTFVEGAIWGVNSFDQWGVELGKTLAKRLMPVVEGGEAPESLDSSTAGLIQRLRALG
jgi:glucose-6-phosphate isomerase